MTRRWHWLLFAVLYVVVLRTDTKAGAFTTLCRRNSIVTFQRRREGDCGRRSNVGATTTTATLLVPTAPRRPAASVYNHDPLLPEDDDGVSREGRHDEDPNDTSHHQAFVVAKSWIPTSLSNPAWTAPLTRLAAAHHGQGVDIGHIQQVAVIGLDESHVDIEAVVCDHETCVSLAVPVPFLHPCLNDTVEDLEGCILENIQKLDHRATLSMQQQQQKQEAVQAAREKMIAVPEQLTQMLQRTDSVQYPSWWVHPYSDMLLADQCEILRKNLNQGDFQADIGHLLKSHHGHNDIVSPIAVVALGPAGLVLRVATSSKDGTGNLDNQRLQMVEVPKAFGETVTDESGLMQAICELLGTTE